MTQYSGILRRLPKTSVVCNDPNCRRNPNNSHRMQAQEYRLRELSGLTRLVEQLVSSQRIFSRSTTGGYLPFLTPANQSPLEKTASSTRTKPASVTPYSMYSTPFPMMASSKSSSQSSQRRLTVCSACRGRSVERYRRRNKRKQSERYGMKTGVQGYNNQYQRQLLGQYKYNARREYDGAIGGLDYLLGNPAIMVAANEGSYFQRKSLRTYRLL